MTWKEKWFQWISDENRAADEANAGNERAARFRIEPPDELKAAGYKLGDQPLAEHHNYLFALLLDLIKELRSGVDTEETTRTEADEQLKKDFEIALEEFANSIIKEIVIPKAGWLDADDGGYQNDVYLAEAKHQHFPIVSIDRGDSMDAARKAEMSTASEATDLSVRFWAKRIPDKDINATVALLFPQRDGSASGGGGESGGGGSEYVLPVATAERLGGIKTGRGLNITPDGTTSVDVEQGGYVATDEEVDTMLDKYFPEN